MSLREFWISVRTGAKFLLPSATVDSPKLDANRIESMLRGTFIWLTPKAVEGFDESDFDFLADGERNRLTQCVNEFVNAAQQVPPDQPATDAQVQAGLTPFQCVLEIMRPDKYGDVEALVIGKRVEQCVAGQLPEWVADLRFETGEDSNGDPAVWIWVEVADVAAEEEVFSKNTKQVRDIIESSLRKLGIQHWPYVRFRTSSEQTATHRENAE